MFAELLTLDRSDPASELLDAYPFKPHGWALAGPTGGSLVDYMRNQIAQTVEKWGVVKTHCLGGKPIGMCAVDTDEWASREMRTPTFRISHIMALGKPGAQMIIKTRLLQEAMRAIPSNTCTGAQIPYSDLTSINALERLEFAATQTSLLMVRQPAGAATNTTTTVTVGSGPDAAAVNLVTNKTYVTNWSSANVTVSDGATNSTTQVAAGSRYINRTHGMTGRRWQRRFFSYPLDDRHPATAVRYVGLNPVRAGLVREAESYHWGMADSAEYVVNGGGAGCGSSSPAVRD
jgi:hypothetical protein